MAHRDNITEVVTGRFANTEDVGGHQGYTHRRKLGSLMQKARQRRQAGSLKQICKKCAHWGAYEQERMNKKYKSKRHQHKQQSLHVVIGSPSSDLMAEVSRGLIPGEK